MGPETHGTMWILSTSTSNIPTALAPMICHLSQPTSNAAFPTKNTCNREKMMKIRAVMTTTIAQAALALDHTSIRSRTQIKLSNTTGTHGQTVDPHRHITLHRVLRPDLTRASGMNRFLTGNHLRRVSLQIADTVPVTGSSSFFMDYCSSIKSWCLVSYFRASPVYWYLLSF